MGCNEIRENFSDYLDNRLDDRLAGEVKHHLKACAACRMELKELALVIQALKKIPELKAPADFLVKLRARIEQEEAPWWKRAVAYLDHGLEVMPLKAMSAMAALILVMVVFLASQDQIPTHKPSLAPVAVSPDSSLPGVLASATDPLPVEFASTRPGTQERPLDFESPTEFLMTVLKNDPAFKNYQILPHPRGVGALVNTPLHLYEVTMDPAEFPIIQTFIEEQGRRMPQSLREARTLYPIYVRVLPSPTAPLSPHE